MFENKGFIPSQGNNTSVIINQWDITIVYQYEVDSLSQQFMEIFFIDSQSEEE